MFALRVGTCTYRTQYVVARLARLVRCILTHKQGLISSSYVLKRTSLWETSVAGKNEGWDVGEEDRIIAFSICTWRVSLTLCWHNNSRNVPSYD